MQEPKKIRGHGTVEKDKRYKNTWKIRFNTGEKDKQGRYVRSPKRTVHGSKADAYAALEAYIAEYEHSQDPANQRHTLPREERDEAIRSLLRRGFSIRQIERLSGIGRGVIQRLRASLDG